MEFNKNILDIDPAEETERLVKWLKQSVQQRLRRTGAIVGLSGGIDSSTVVGLCARAFGPERVVAILMPDQDSDGQSEIFAQKVADRFGIKTIHHEITEAVKGFGGYDLRDAAIRAVFPEYDPAAGYKAKIVLPSNLLEDNSLNVFSVTIVTPAGEEKSKRLNPREYLQIVAASNLKQRSRMATLYYHAESRNYAVVGTSNKNEHDQGFLVKYGDGGVDIQLIAHLYKTQVYQLAAYLGVPQEVQDRTPTSDTYSAHQTQEEFFFRLPFATMDLLWYAQEHGIPAEQVAEVMDLTVAQVQRAYADFVQKHRSTEYLRLPSLKWGDTSTN
ncbi:NAD(+) synthase [Thiocapsa imhoffii]|uniref:NH(3)-dependent NAD(+) synthetase n=1 Tax=Thiocapsa imhoffii TaxID=382777 RepID=A0A9X0WFB3_9GAMM|nr:NAD(+) synthase [Thiocapsa imhoffii]